MSFFLDLLTKYSKTTDYEQEDKGKQENFISASNEGELPTIDDLAASLRMNPSRFEDILHLPKYVRKIFPILLLLVFVIFVLMVVVLYMSTH